MSEKISQSLFVERLKQAHWYVREQVTDHTKQSRADVVAYHPTLDENIAFEIKVPQGLSDETKALRQMIRYKNTYFHKFNVSIFCYMKLKTRIDPYSAFTEDNDWVSKRFFWRWGFGYGYLENMIVEFVNGDAKNTLDLLYPTNSPNTSKYTQPDVKEKIAHIKQTSQKYWMNDCDTDQL